MSKEARGVAHNPDPAVMRLLCGGKLRHLLEFTVCFLEILLASGAETRLACGASRERAS